MARGPSPKLSPGLEVSAGIGIRNHSATGEGKDRVSWENDHRILPGWVRPIPGPNGLPAFDAALYSVTMLRHDASPSIVVPTSPPVGIPFPFDIGLDADVGRVTSLVYPGLREVRIGVARGALLLDPWRSGLPGHSFSFGVGARYDVETALGGGRIVHRIAPMTAGSLRLRYLDAATGSPSSTSAPTRSPTTPARARGASSAPPASTSSAPSSPSTTSPSPPCSTAATATIRSAATPRPSPTSGRAWGSR